MSLTQKVAHNTIIQFAGKALSICLGVLTVAIMARYLGKIGFGQYSTIMAYLQFFGILVDMGLALTVVRLLADPQHEAQKVVNNVFTLRFFSALVFLGLAPLVIIFFPYDNLIKLGVAITTLSFFCISLNQIFIALFQKELKMASVTISEVANRVLLLVLVFVFAILDKGLLYIMLAVVSASVLNLVLNYLLALRFIKINFSFDWSLWKKIISLTWPIAISIAFNLVYFKADTIIISLTRTQAEVGIYSAPYRVLEIMTNFIYMFMGIIFPLLASFWLSANKEKFRQLFQNTFDFLIIMAVPMIFGTFFVAKNLMLLIAGPEFGESAIVLKLIIFATAIIFVNSLYGYSIVVIDKQKPMVGAYIFVAIVALVGYLLTIPRYGYLGAAIFTIISEFLIFAFNFFVTSKTTGFIPNGKIIIKTIAASLVMSATLYFCQSLQVLLQILLASIVYLIALYAFKGYDKKLILEIMKIKQKNLDPEFNIDNT